MHLLFLGNVVVTNNDGNPHHQLNVASDQPRSPGTENTYLFVNNTFVCNRDTDEIHMIRVGGDPADVGFYNNIFVAPRLKEFGVMSIRERPGGRGAGGDAGARAETPRRSELRCGRTARRFRRSLKDTRTRGGRAVCRLRGKRPGARIRLPLHRRRYERGRRRGAVPAADEDQNGSRARSRRGPSPRRPTSAQSARRSRTRRTIRSGCGSSGAGPA